MEALSESRQQSGSRQLKIAILKLDIKEQIWPHLVGFVETQAKPNVLLLLSKNVTICCTMIRSLLR